jgi:DNA-binding GntR family transcriptional regulator
MEAIANRLLQRSKTVPTEKAPLFVDFLDLDIKFHAAVARYAGFEVAVCFLRKLHNLMVLAIPTTKKPDRVRDILEEHERIIEALQFRTMPDVKAAIRDNLFGFTRLWRPYDFLEKIWRTLVKSSRGRQRRAASRRW